jgi:DNA-binding MarR family transcriptional regulator
MNRAVLEKLDADQIDFGEMRDSLGLLLRLAQVKVFDAFFENLAKHGLKPGEFTMLWVIGLNPDSRQGVIARRLRIKPAHMTKLVQRNVDKGLVERDIPDDDRRSVHLRLTDKGQRFVADKKPEFLDFVAKENTRLTKSEFRSLIRILQKFNDMEDGQ